MVAKITATTEYLHGLKEIAHAPNTCNYKVAIIAFQYINMTATLLKVKATFTSDETNQHHVPDETQTSPSITLVIFLPKIRNLKLIIMNH